MSPDVMSRWAWPTRPNKLKHRTGVWTLETWRGWGPVKSEAFGAGGETGCVSVFSVLWGPSPVWPRVWAGGGRKVKTRASWCHRPREGLPSSVSQDPGCRMRIPTRGDRLILDGGVFGRRKNMKQARV